MDRTAPGMRARWLPSPIKALAVLVLAAGITACATRAPDARRPCPVPCLWPTPSAARTVTSTFGEPRGAGGGRTRPPQGIDISAPKGCPVYATADGAVCCSGRDRGGYGKYVVVCHSQGYSTLYAHLSEIKVKKGARVKAGQILGQTGKTGHASGCHLHYEVRRDDRPIDPTPCL